MVILPDARKVRKTVHGDTPMDCIRKMEELEKQAYNREIGTTRNQIEKSDIGHCRYQSIT